MVFVFDDHYQLTNLLEAADEVGRGLRVGNGVLADGTDHVHHYTPRGHIHNLRLLGKGEKSLKIYIVCRNTTAHLHWNRLLDFSW